MRKFLLSAVAALLPAAAGAADMAMKAPGLIAPSSACAWCGFELGIHSGYGWNEIRSALLEEDVGKLKPNSFLIGGHAGYNWQHGIFVPGIEVDVTYAGKTDTVIIGKEDAIASKVKYLGSARARLGVAFSDGFMVYGTGGLGWANSQVSIPVEGMASSANHFGWVGGGGIEIKLFTNNWIGRLEYLHYDLGGASYFGVIDATLKQDVVRAAISYRFH